VGLHDTRHLHLSLLILGATPLVPLLIGQATNSFEQQLLAGAVPLNDLLAPGKGSEDSQEEIGPDG
jgi:hypothetical protein